MDVLALVQMCAGTLGLFGIGWLGYRAAKKMLWPSAAMLGSLLFLGCFYLIGGKLPFYKAPVAFFSKVLSGVILGQKIDRGTMSLVRRMGTPVALSSFWMVAASIMTGLGLYRLADDRLSLLTCLASASAGGIAEMSIFAMSVGADVGIVAFFQSVRIVVLYVTLPFTTSFIAGHTTAGSTVVNAAEKPTARFAMPEIVRFALVTCITAVIFEKLGVPSGIMLGAMCGSGALNLWSGKVMKLPQRLRVAAQICLSITICVGLSPHTIVMLTELFLPLFFAVAGIQLFSLALAFLINRMTHWDIMTSVLATCPGGLSQVVFMAEDLHADPLIVGVFHAVRMVSIVVFVPLIAKLIS